MKRLKFKHKKKNKEFIQNFAIKEMLGRILKIKLLKNQNL